MQLYDCEVRLGGSLMHTVTKNEVTAPEIMCLRAIHGGDAVVNIRPRRNDRRSHRAEVDRLRAKYPKAFAEVFGTTHIERLPQKLDGVGVTEEVEEVEEDGEE